jgi:hypothetical protein
MAVMTGKANTLIFFLFYLNINYMLGCARSAWPERSGWFALQGGRPHTNRPHAGASQPIVFHTAVRPRRAQAMGRILPALC